MRFLPRDWAMEPLLTGEARDGSHGRPVPAELRSRWGRCCVDVEWTWLLTLSPQSWGVTETWAPPHGKTRPRLPQNVPGLTCHLSPPPPAPTTPVSVTRQWVRLPVTTEASEAETGLNHM